MDQTKTQCQAKHNNVTDNISNRRDLTEASKKIIIQKLIIQFDAKSLMSGGKCAQWNEILLYKELSN